MKLTPQEKQQLLVDIKQEFLKRFKERAVDQLFVEHESRIQHYYAKIKGELRSKLESELPL